MKSTIFFFTPHKEKRYGWVKNSHMHTKETGSVECEKLKGKCSFAAAAGEPGVKYRWAALTLASHISKARGKDASYSICLNTCVEVVYFLSLLWDNSRPLSDVYLHNPENNQLDGSSGVPLLGHGAAERLHGLVVGASQQRLAVNRNQLVVDAQTSVLWITLDIITHVHFWCSRQQITTPNALHGFNLLLPPRADWIWLQDRWERAWIKASVTLTNHLSVFIFAHLAVTQNVWSPCTQPLRG